MGEIGKPGTNWKQVTPANRKKVAPLVEHYRKQAHPFTACVRDNTKRFGPERAKRVCAVVKDLGEKSTAWHGKSSKKKVMAAAVDVDDAAFVEAHWDDVVAPALDEAGVSVDELADWAELAAAAGVLEAVELDEDGDFSRVVEAAATAAPMSHTRRRSGESLTGWGKRLKKGDAANKAAMDAKKKGRGGKNADFEGKHPRTRGGEWTVKVGGQTVKVKDNGKGNLVSSTSAQAIKDFQKKHGLKVDGVIGQQTATALLGHTARAKKTAVGKMRAGQRSHLLGSKRVREAAGIDLADVTFEPAELVEAARELA